MNIVELYLKEQGGIEISPPLLNSSLIYQTRGWNQAKYFRSLFKKDYSFPLLISVKKDRGVMFFSLGNAKLACLEVMQNVWDDKNYLDVLEKNFQKFAKHIEGAYSKLTYKFINNNDNLQPDLKEIIDNTWNLSSLLFFTVGLDKDVFEKFGRLDNVFWQQASMLNTDSFVSRGEKKLKGLVEKGYDWDCIAEQLQYLEVGFDRVLTLDFTKEALQARYKNLSLQENKKSINTKWKDSLSGQAKTIADFFQWAIDKRDLRKDYYGMLLAIMGRYTEHVFDQADLPKELMPFCLFEEVEKGADFLKDNIDQIKKRKSGFTVLVHPDGSKDFEYNFYDSLIKIDKNQDKIKGQTGSPGHVKGKVRVITNVLTEAKKFKPGEILVAGMTRPEYVNLMKKASAIITDEGGITCHAAIVSRELGIPCVIGTKIATQVLQDGDKVEVDATNGMVKKL